MSAGANSRISVTFPAGTGFGAFTSAVFDITSNRSVGNCGAAVGQLIQCQLFTNEVIAAGDQVRITFNGITNPASAGPYTLDVSTTSDTTPVTSSPSVTDPTPPDTVIDSGPSGTVNDSTPTFAFSSNEPGSRFECRVDSAPFAPCTSPFTTATLSDGAHTFEVLAIDAAGNRDPTVSSRTFTVATATAAQQPPPLTLEDLPVPEIGEEVNIGPVGDGPVLIAVPAGSAAAGGAGVQGPAKRA